MEHSGPEKPSAHLEVVALPLSAALSVESWPDAAPLSSREAITLGMLPITEALAASGTCLRAEMPRISFSLSFDLVRGAGFPEHAFRSLHWKTYTPTRPMLCQVTDHNFAGKF